MRTLEKLIFVVMIPATLWLFHSQWPVWMGLCAVAAAVLVPVHAFVEGMHWQMAPAYLAAGVLLLSEPGGLWGGPVRPYCAIGVCLLLSSSLALSWALPMFELPKPTGKYPVGTRRLPLIDPDRAEMHPGARPGNREVVVQLWYPSATDKWPKAKYRRRREASLRSSYHAVLRTQAFQSPPIAAGRFPVIVHNPAWHDSCCRGTFMLQELASHGFVVAAVSHPYNTNRVELSDAKVALPDLGLDLGFSAHHYIPLKERIELAEEELAIQTKDCRFVLNELQRLDQTPGNPLESHLQMDRVGGHGFSFGGAVSMELTREDARMCSALEMDGVLHGSVALHGLDKPFMLIDSEWMAAPQENEAAPNIGDVENARLWKNIADAKAFVLSRSGGIRIIFRGIGHSDFSDQIFMSPLRKLTSAGSVPPERVALILNAYCVAFFRQTLYGSEEKLLGEGAQPFDEVKLTVWQPSKIAECLG